MIVMDDGERLMGTSSEGNGDVTGGGDCDGDGAGEVK